MGIQNGEHLMPKASRSRPLQQSNAPQPKAPNSKNFSLPAKASTLIAKGRSL